MQDGWEVLYQRNHAMLAAALASAWDEDLRVHPPRLWSETLVAIAQHDDEENFWSEDNTHLNDMGAPLDFTRTSSALKLKKVRFVTAQAERQHRWIATLIARHHLHIYQQARQEHTDLNDFLDQQAEAVERWLAELSIEKDLLERTYAIMRWCDRLSLILCKRQVPVMGRELDIAPGPDSNMIRIWRGEDDSLRLSKWVFGPDKILFEAEARLLEQPTFEDGEELRMALDSARVVERHWQFERV